MITIQNAAYQRSDLTPSREIPKQSHTFQAPSYFAASSSQSTGMPKVVTKEEWLKLYTERVDLIIRIEKALNNGLSVDFASKTEFAKGFPVLKETFLSVAYHNRDVQGVLLYYKLANSPSNQWITDIFRYAQPHVLTQFLKFLIQLMQSKPEFVPKHLIQYYLSKDLKGDIDYDYQGFWQLLVEFSSAFSLTPQEILEGLTKKELNAILSKNATKLGISKNDIQAAKDKLASPKENKPMVSFLNVLFG